jgi:hypothetical protein
MSNAVPAGSREVTVAFNAYQWTHCILLWLFVTQLRFSIISDQLAYTFFIEMVTISTVLTYSNSAVCPQIIYIGFVRLDSDYFPERQQAVHLRIGDAPCFLWRRNWIFKYCFDELRVSESQHVFFWNQNSMYDTPHYLRISEQVRIFLRTKRRLDSAINTANFNYISVFSCRLINSGNYSV